MTTKRITTIAAACLFMSSMSMAQTTTTVAQTVLAANSTTATPLYENGTAYITPSAQCRNGAYYIGSTRRSVPYTAGAFSVALVPTDACPVQGHLTGSAWLAAGYPAGSQVTYSGGVYVSLVSTTASAIPGSSASWKLISPTYNVTWVPTGGAPRSEVWAVPTSGSPLTVDQVRISIPAITAMPVPGPPGVSGPMTWQQLLSGGITWGSLGGN